MMSVMRTDAQRDQASLRRRLEVLQLPVVPLHRHGFVMPAGPAATVREPEAVGVGPDGTAYAVWPYRDGSDRKQVTWHVGGRRRVVGAVDVETDLRVSFVQPLPKDRVLLADARAKPGAVNAEVWTSGGELRHRAHIGDAIEELLTTPAGKVWAGYFDEAMGGSGPEGHGLARFREDLTVEWLYPRDAGLPSISDCYSLNVEGETAYFCPYTGFHVLSATGARVTDWGPSPSRSAHHLLRRGADLALLAGWGPEYDVATLLRITRDGVRQEGGRCRVVLPDGMEAHGLRYTGRGDVLHAFLRSTWYTIDLDVLSAAANPGRA
ncbi:hypothetical protein ADK67_47400 [Saccharothrix sp. NRRL B-16348]|uniref:hypothetical protein n=1 Tax=Saccharothrix sp. NRRL B-16348 TaxID=1415542 RepID=UPI0006C02336|nr:hypothetical protein [Saccharothrix sp. NRRL B-16348]KOX12153.1 hypothetical protein ADK67_47400 [Saccharothrix sp. NRRL B-16348]